jgi:hypothetical protein
MMDEKRTKSDWEGRSGFWYTFTDYTLDTDFKEGIEGIYIFSKMTKTTDGNRLFVPLYIGEGILRDRIKFRLDEGEVQKKGCNCVSVRIEDAQKERKWVEQDLLAENPIAYAPTGCNKKEGG